MKTTLEKEHVLEKVLIQIVVIVVIILEIVVKRNHTIKRAIKHHLINVIVIKINFLKYISYINVKLENLSSS